MLDTMTIEPIVSSLRIRVSLSSVPRNAKTYWPRAARTQGTVSGTVVKLQAKLDLWHPGFANVLLNRSSRNS